MADAASDSFLNPSAPPFPFLEQNRFRALLFDWDGVLVDSGEDYYRAYELALEPEGLKLAPREVMLREGRKTSEVIAALYEDRGIALPSAKLDELVARRLGFYKKTARAIFFDGIWEMVEALRVAQYKLGIVTGSSRIHDVLPLSAEREKLFDTVVTADDIRRPKPDPEPFQVACGRIGI
ncbi:MAG TPA: HAD family phosphatase, partial [Candidatus Acidoferrales bacterium]|nr:HAD family phosphatase [Candidatus Acidoferrales bacterium]